MQEPAAKAGKLALQSGPQASALGIRSWHSPANLITLFLLSCCGFQWLPQLPFRDEDQDLQQFTVSPCVARSTRKPPGGFSEVC